MFMALPLNTRISTPEGEAGFAQTLFGSFWCPPLWKWAPWLPAASSTASAGKEGCPGICSSPTMATMLVAGERAELPINSISLLLPVFFFLRFLLYGGKGMSICYQLSLATPGHHLTCGFVNPVIIDIFQDEVGLLGFPRDNTN